MKEYFDENCDVQDMIADFMKNLLIEKPEDVIDFADTFFSEFVGIVWAERESSASCGSNDDYLIESENSSRGSRAQDIPDKRMSSEGSNFNLLHEHSID